MHRHSLLNVRYNACYNKLRIPKMLPLTVTTVTGYGQVRPPHPHWEYYEVPAASARLIDAAREPVAGPTNS